LNDTWVEAVEELAALHDNFLKTEGPSHPPLSCSRWHPMEQIVQ
jgi:hypothetical protein